MSDWIRPSLLERHQYFLDRDAYSGERPIYPDHARDTICGWLTDPAFLRMIEQEECLSAYAGIELRHAFLDQNLVEFVLSVPFEKRLQLPGPFKTLKTVLNTPSLASEGYVQADLIAERWSGPISSDLAWFEGARPLWQPVFLE